MQDLVKMVVDDFIMMTDGWAVCYNKVLKAGRKHHLSCVESSCRERLKLSFVESIV